MSIENTLDSIASSLAIIAECMKSERPAQPAAPVAAPAPAPAPAPVAAPVAPMGNVQPAPTPVAPAPAPVAPVAPAPVSESHSDCPIKDQQSLVQYVMDSYKALGPVKGNQIQGVLAACGITHINETKPEQYGAIFAGVESLKAQ